MPPRKLTLILVAYHPSAQEIARLQASLVGLTSSVGYGVVVNDHQPGEAVDQLRAEADFFLCLERNHGYGRAINHGLALVADAVPYVAALNTDLEWDPDTFEQIICWLDHAPEVVLAVPQIVNPDGEIQQLCKQDPTILALLSRRFVPDRLKPAWLRRYDAWYAMDDSGFSHSVRAKPTGHDMIQAIDVPYLSGCCMVLRAGVLRQAGGFDERYFLYLEDADLTRDLRIRGRCVHFPLVAVRHRWGRGNHRNWRLTLVNLHSAWLYFQKWGWRLW